MSRCLRIFGAYSFRLTRRHSTILLIASFLIALTMVLQFYAHRHHDQSQSKLKWRSAYKPGAFLKHKQPGNTSYCFFNYGLPHKLQLNKIQTYPSPESGNQSSYKVIYDAIIGLAYLNRTKSQEVTYVTHATPEFLYHLVEIARYWDGPISIAVYVPHYDLDLTMQVMYQLCHCYPGMNKVSMHLFYPKRFPPRIRTWEEKKLTLTTMKSLVPLSSDTVERLMSKRLNQFRKLNNMTRGKYIEWVRQTKIDRMMMGLKQEMIVPNLNFPDCSGLDYFDFLTFRKAKLMMYPVNVGRNVARNASKTNYFLVSDIELIPSNGLATKFLKMIRKLMGNAKRDAGCVFAKTVFVVPIFEVEKGVVIPHDKALLVELLKRNLARYFHQRLCSHCQRFPGMQTWLSRPARDVLEPMMISKREYPYHRWEPLYFGTNKEPWYSEMLTWEGRQDKMTQVWSDFKNNTKKKWAKINKAARGTGGGPALKVILTDLEERVMAIIGEQAATGLAIAEAGFDDQMLEMCLQEYSMVVLDGGFLCHAANQQPKHFFKRSMWMNRRNYRNIVQNYKNKYKDIEKCKVMFGCR